MPITDWPEDERPREKLLSSGSTSLSDAELFAIFLRTGTRNKTAIDLARKLIEHRNLRTLLETDHSIICQTSGIGIAKYVQLQAGLELGRRYLESNLSRDDILESPKDTKDYLRVRLCAYP